MSSSNQPATTHQALLPGRVGLFVRLEAVSGRRPALLDALHRYADELSTEPGTEAFVISLDPENDDVVWLYEWFTDEASLEAHRASDPLSILMGELPELLAQPPGLLRVDPLRLHLRHAILTDPSTRME